GGVPPLFGEPFDARVILGGFFGREEALAYCREVTRRYYQELPQVWASCFRLSEEQSPHVVNITARLQTLSLQDLGQLRQEQYSNLTTAADGAPSVLRESIASRLLLAVA